MPLLSIVIANYNYGRFIGEAIRSVLSQSCQDFELIVVDGGSTDNSAEIIKQYSDRIFWWVSEKDQGQSDAFTKGFAHARGRFLTWLNADDVMMPNAIAKLKTASEKYKSCEWFAIGCFWLDPELRVINCSRARGFSRLRALTGDVQVYGPSSFFARTLYNRVGGTVDLSFHYMMDVELWNRFYHFGHASYRRLSGYGWGLRLHRDAKMSSHNFADSPTADPTHPVWQKRRQESDALKDRYQKIRPSRIIRALSASYVLWLKGRIDLLRFRGKNWKDAVGAVV